MCWKKAKELDIFQRKIYSAIQKVINFSKIRNNKQPSELENIKSVSHPCPINNKIMNCEKYFDEAYNLYPEESNKI